ncbi:integrin alpha-L-like isoform X3 [Struthio camelus]|uniref:integrin alpha-L-like isoform X3 n=1 Tax=Struthio camelus TaxID=8801 RepID=UPI003603EC93
MHPDAWVPGLWCTRTPGSLTHSAPGRLGPHEAQSPWGGRGGPGIRDRRRLRRRQKETGAPAPPQCVAAAAAAASMAGPGLVLLGIALAGLSSAAGFNLDPVPFRLLAPNISESFGHQVLQLNGSRILVGAPAAAAEGAGRLYECRVDTGSCRELPLADNGSVPHLGMALARTDTGAIACGPGLSRECDRNVYVSGLCYELGPRLGAPRVLAPGYQGCLPGTVDLAFLFDGSNSMTSAQFGTIRDFMVDVMEQLHNSSIHFAAVQFSDRTRTEFTLRDYAARPEPRALLRHVQQLRSLTDTFSAITYVAKNIFTPENGARAGAKRVMIIITDGDATDTGDVSAAEERGILRYIIGVGNNFGSPDTRLYLSQFASQPSTEFVKVLDSFEKLKGLFKELQAKIYDIEGTSTHNRFHLELSSSGFSLAVAGGRVVTGAVGADDWAGGLLELAAPGDVFVPSPALAANLTDSYLGYAVASMARRGRALYAAGAPRHGHVGRVVVFEAPPPGAGPWRPVQFLPGQQIGSYFGAVLCALDLDADGLTDLLLVGAHLHYDGRRGGRVHVYRWHGETLEAAGELLGAPGHPLGRFGAALAALGDLDGDGWAEAAVGAPLEDAEAGAVYVFRGHSQGLGPGYSQPCLDDIMTPMRVAIDFSLEPSADGPILPPGTTTAWSEVPFALACGPDDVCQSDLGLRPLPPAPPELLLAPGAELGLRLALRNGAEAARRAALRLPLPPGLALRRARTAPGSWATALSCRERVEAEAGAGARTLWCNVSHPVFHAGRETHIELTFDVLRNRSWDAELQLTATASSDNEPNSSLADNAASWRLPVRYLANIMASGLGSSTAYLNFSSRHPENKTLLHLYELKLISPWDLGMPRPTVTAFVLVPHELQAGLTWAKLNVTAEPGGTCHPDAGDTSEAVCAVASGLQEACDISRATTYRCHLGVLVTTATIRVAGVVQPPPKIEVPARSHLCSRLCFAVDTRRFASRGDVTSVQVTTKVELLREVNLRWLYFGSALGGLGLLLLIVFGLAKCGFFKRDYRERLDQDAVGDRTGDNEDAGEAGDAPAGDPEGDTGAGGLEPLQGDEGAL